MAMLLRTRKIALGLKVICIVTVCAIYALLPGTEEDLDFVFPGSHHQSARHLLASVTSPNCTPAAINEFPSDGFTRSQRRSGFILIHVLGACYLFALLAIVCEDYFVPAIKKFCDRLGMREDVAGATFMAVASSSPELFTNCVGTFVTEGDLGVGAVVGSAVFNVLAVPACCGLFANMVVDLEWWPISRDCMMYSVSVILLISFLHDGRIYFHEAFTLISVYVIYLLIMVFNGPLMRFTEKLIAKCRRKKRYVEILAESTPLLLQDKRQSVALILEQDITLKDCEELGECCLAVFRPGIVVLEESTKIWEWPRSSSTKGKIWWVLTWPIALVLKATIPDCRRYPRFFVVTFLMCILWIGGVSYLISWLITAIGDTLNIPDSVMGLTFLAAGMSVPESVSSIIVTNQGLGSMGLSSSIASNTFDILLCLGLPWLIKTGLYPKVTNNHYIKINSAGLTYSTISLLSTLLLFYLSVALNGFRLNWKVGLTCLGTYVGFLVLATLIELNVFFPVNLPTCDR